ncbi:unnamed protein product [Alopecurus aequalis]
MDLTLQLIEIITNNFSDDQKIGSGAYGEVYKGVYNGKEIAMKRLYNIHGINDEAFTNEFRNLMKVKHQNIIELIGYCYEIRHKHVMDQGQLVFSKIIERVLCFEYMEGGSLADHIYDESCGFDWPTRYKIIKGVCEGLNHLHNGQNDHIFHLDMKPGNVLLDKDMLPRIADFGMSKLLASSKSLITQTVKGTRGYSPPEFSQTGRITKKYDVFSVGVIIIKVIGGATAYDCFCDMSSPQKFIELLHENWKKRFHAMKLQGDAPQEMDIVAVRRCIEMAVTCVEVDQVKRPSIKEVIDELNKLDADILRFSPTHISVTGQETSGSKDIEVDPTIEIRFPFQLNREMSCCVQLTNRTNDYIAFNIKINKMKYRARPNNGTMPPCSKIYITLTLKAHEEAPTNMWCEDMLLLQSTRVSDGSINVTDEFFVKDKESMMITEVKMPIVYVA